MGQYFKAVIEQEKKTEVIESTHGQKLMEFSWIDCYFPNFVASKLLNKKGRVAFVGDYADKVKIKKIPIDKLFEYCWGENRTPKKTSKTNFSIDDKFIINHTTKEFLDCNAYIKNSTKDDECIHPLPLLTAIGNGLGGGDFSYPQDEAMLTKVGIWAYDELEITNTKPSKYKEFTCIFIEQ